MVGSTAETTRANVKAKIDSFVEGDLEHASEVLSALLEIATKDENIVPPANTLPQVNSFHFCLLFLG